MISIDTNILLPALDADNKEHEVASDFLESLLPPENLGFARVWNPLARGA